MLSWNALLLAICAPQKWTGPPGRPLPAVAWCCGTSRQCNQTRMEHRALTGAGASTYTRHSSPHTAPTSGLVIMRTVHHRAAHTYCLGHTPAAHTVPLSSQKLGPGRLQRTAQASLFYLPVSQLGYLESAWARLQGTSISAVPPQLVASRGHSKGCPGGTRCGSHS